MTPTELADLVSALSARYGRIRHVILNGFAWTNHVRRLADGDRTLRIGWFASMSPALLVAITDADKQVDLLIVPASFDAGGAARAMAKAADPSNVEHAPDLLAAEDFAEREADAA